MSSAGATTEQDEIEKQHSVISKYLKPCWNKTFNSKKEKKTIFDAFETNPQDDARQEIKKLIKQKKDKLKKKMGEYDRKLKRQQNQNSTTEQESSSEGEATDGSFVKILRMGPRNEGDVPIGRIRGAHQGLTEKSKLPTVHHLVNNRKSTNSDLGEISPNKLDWEKIKAMKKAQKTPKAAKRKITPPV